MRAKTPAHLITMYLFVLTVKDETSPIIYSNTLTVSKLLPILFDTHRTLQLDFREIVGRIRTVAKVSSVQQSDKDGSETHPASYLMGNFVFFLGGKAAEACS